MESKMESIKLSINKKLMSVDCLNSTGVQKDYRSWNTMSWSWLLYGAEIGGREQSSWEPPREGSRVERAGVGRPRGSFCYNFRELAGNRRIFCFYYPDSLGKPAGNIIHSTILNRRSLIFMTWAFSNLIYRHLPQCSQILEIVKRFQVKSRTLCVWLHISYLFRTFKSVVPIPF